MNHDAPALAWHYDERLREVPDDRAAFEAALDTRVDEIATARSQPARLLAMLLEATPLLRIAGRAEEARRTASAAIALAELVEDPLAEYAGQLALAELMRQEGRYEISTPLFDQLVARARSMPMHDASLHDALFAAGRNLFEQAHYAQAARHLRECQALRRSAAHDDLLEVTASALRLCNERLRR